MKGYKNNLKEFIGYIFNKYSNDKEVAQFKEIYEKREQARIKEAERRTHTEKKSITISIPTANLCKAMISGELEKFKILLIENDYTLKLSNAYNELTNGYIESISDVLRRLNEYNINR